MYVGNSSPVAALTYYAYDYKSNWENYIFFKYILLNLANYDGAFHRMKNLSPMND